MNIPLPNTKFPPKFKRKENTNQLNEVENEEEKIRKRKEELLRLKKEEESEKETLVEMRKRVVLPKVIEESNNEDLITSYIFLKKRNYTDGCININIEANDISNENPTIYQSKSYLQYIDIQQYSQLENSKDGLLSLIPNKNKKFYIESIKQNRFYEIVDENEYKNINKKSEVNMFNSLSNLGLGKEKNNKYTSENKENKELNIILDSITNNILIIFLFAQGLLAGISIANIIFLFSIPDFLLLVNIYSFFCEILYEIIHFLSFGSLIGNGIRLISIIRIYYTHKKVYSNGSILSKIKRKVVVSHIILWLLCIGFILLLIIASNIQAISYYSYSNNKESLLNQDDFNNFKAIYLTVNVIFIINFLVNVGSVSKVSDVDYEIQRIN
jgi:hypothetical protein